MEETALPLPSAQILTRHKLLASVGLEIPMLGMEMETESFIHFTDATVS